MGDFLHTAGEWYADAETGKGIQTSTDMKHHAISAKLDTPFSNKDKTLVVQFTGELDNLAPPIFPHAVHFQCCCLGSSLGPTECNVQYVDAAVSSE